LIQQIRDHAKQEESTEDTEKKKQKEIELANARKYMIDDWKRLAIERDASLEHFKSLPANKKKSTAELKEAFSQALSPPRHNTEHDPAHHEMLGMFPRMWPDANNMDTT